MLCHCKFSFVTRKHSKVPCVCFSSRVCVDNFISKSVRSLYGVDDFQKPNLWLVCMCCHGGTWTWGTSHWSSDTLRYSNDCRTLHGIDVLAVPSSAQCRSCHGGLQCVPICCCHAQPDNPASRWIALTLCSGCRLHLEPPHDVPKQLWP